MAVKYLLHNLRFLLLDWWRS